VTVSEGLLLPGAEAILAPDWVPWRERLRPGDLRPGDLLPAAPDDARLVPMATLDGDDGLTDWGESSWVVPGLELAGLAAADADLDEDATDSADLADDGDVPDAAAVATRAAAQAGVSAAPDTVPLRARVLSAIGRDDTALRWYTSEHGPKGPLAHAAPGLCASCGFYVRMAGPLGQVFGVCANAYAPDDGRVVAIDHGCGAHSEAVFAPSAEQPLRPVIDELGYDLVDQPGVSIEETVFESLEHN
jgi:hypothetical protein